MYKKFLFLISALMLFTSSFAEENADPISLQIEDIDPTSGHGDPHKGPVQIPSISLDGHTLFFFSPCDGDTLRLVDEDGVVVYSLIIPDGTYSLELPITLSGNYELQIIRGNFCFWGEIEL